MYIHFLSFQPNLSLIDGEESRDVLLIGGAVPRDQPLIGGSVSLSRDLPLIGGNNMPSSELFAESSPYWEKHVKDVLKSTRFLVRLVSMVVVVLTIVFSCIGMIYKDLKE